MAPGRLLKPNPMTFCLTAAMDVELARLGWSAATLSERLYQWFVKRERSLLTDDQLHELLELLQGTSTPAEVA